MRKDGGFFFFFRPGRAAGFSTKNFVEKKKLTPLNLRSHLFFLRHFQNSCSFGVVGVGALRDLMLGEAKSRKKKVINAVYVTGECNTAGFYLGRDPAMLTPTVLMRQGAAAVWLSTRSSFTLGGDKKRGGKGGEKAPSSPHKRKIRAKYELQHFVKVHRGADDVAYKSMGLRGDKEWLKEGKGEQGGEEEENGGENGENGDEQNDEPERIGIYFTRDVPRAASVAIDKVLRKIAPKLLSPRQLLREGLRIRREKKERKRLEKKARTSSSPSPSPASPKNRFSFADCCEHFALHPGIHSMLVGFARGLRLPVHKVLPSFAALRDYANLSAASTWYVMAYLESLGDGGEGESRRGGSEGDGGRGEGEGGGAGGKGGGGKSRRRRGEPFRGIRRGERVLQLGVGSGVKAGICVWEALRDIEREDHAAWRHLRGRPVEERELPLAVPDIFAEERERERERGGGGGTGGGGTGGGSAAVAAADAADETLAALADSVSEEGGKSATAAGTTTSNTAAAAGGASAGKSSGGQEQKQPTKAAEGQRPRRPFSEVRPLAMERCEAQGKEYDEVQRKRKERKQREEDAAAAAEAAAAAAANVET